MRAAYTTMDFMFRHSQTAVKKVRLAKLVGDGLHGKSDIGRTIGG